MNYLKYLIKKVIKKFNIKIIFDEDYFNIDIQKLKKSFEEINVSTKIINIEDLLSHFSKKYKDSKAQLMQDLFVDYVLNKENGFFVEVGACDGLVHSNSYYLEKNKKWNGILCEPSEFWHEKLIINRPNCFIEKKPIFSDLKKKVNFSVKAGGRSHIDNNDNDNDKNLIDSITLNQLFLKQGVDIIDYLSIDTEGSEFDILSALNFNKYRPTIITVEHNYKKINRKKIFNLLKNNNYSRYFKSISRFDDWYIDNNFKR